VATAPPYPRLTCPIVLTANSKLSVSVLLASDKKSSKTMTGSPSLLFFLDQTSTNLELHMPKRLGFNFEFTGSPFALSAALLSNPKGQMRFLALC
jgi:hypothetical protein